MTKAAAKAVTKEKRKYQRLPLSFPVFVKGVDGLGDEFLEFATAMNISAGGVLVAIRRSLPRETCVSLEIPVTALAPKDHASQSVHMLRAKSVRAVHGAQCHLIAFKFVRPLPQ